MPRKLPKNNMKIDLVERVARVYAHRAGRDPDEVIKGAGSPLGDFRVWQQFTSQAQEAIACVTYALKGEY